MIDTRPRYTFEEGYCRSDYSFYNKYLESLPAWDHFHTLQSQRDEWVVTSTYVHKGKWSSEIVCVLDNLKGVQIEAALFGFKRVVTQHEKDLAERREYEEFLHRLALLVPPAGLSRWHSDVVGMFENDFEDVLCYGED